MKRKLTIEATIVDGLSGVINTLINCEYMTLNDLLNEVNKSLKDNKLNRYFIAGIGSAHLWLSYKMSGKRILILTEND